MVTAARRHLVSLPGEVTHGVVDQLGLDPGESHRGALRAELLDDGHLPLRSMFFVIVSFSSVWAQWPPRSAPVPSGR